MLQSKLIGTPFGLQVFVNHGLTMITNCPEGSKNVSWESIKSIVESFHSKKTQMWTSWWPKNVNICSKICGNLWWNKRRLSSTHFGVSCFISIKALKFIIHSNLKTNLAPPYPTILRAQQWSTELDSEWREGTTIACRKRGTRERKHYFLIVSQRSHSWSTN